MNPLRALRPWSSLSRAATADRRAFLAAVGAAAAAPALAAQDEQNGSSSAPAQSAPAGPPGIDASTIAAAEKLAKVSFDEKKRAQILTTVGFQLDTYDRLRDAKIQNGEAPAEIFDPRVDVHAPRPGGAEAAPSAAPGPLPSDDDSILFASVAHLSHWIHARALTSERLTRLCLERLKRLDAKLFCVVTLCEESALAQARRCDAELASGKDRGPLHGIPYGAKDLFDTRGIRTTWGAEPWKDRIPTSDAAVVAKLRDAGAVLAAKLSLGALAYGDIWFGGKTRNPWNPAQGSSGSSAGSCAAVAAGCLPFALGTETYGSIMSPSTRCGTTGFRPTFGTVSRAGAMALCWSLDKVGPIARTAEDCASVLRAIAGYDAADAAMRADVFDGRGVPSGTLPSEKLTVGVLRGARADADDAAMLGAIRKLGCTVRDAALAPGPYGEVIGLLIAVEAAAAFDELTRRKLDDQLTWQANEAWPNTFRATRFVPAVEYVQAQRLRRRFMDAAHRLFSDVDIVIAVDGHGEMHPLTNMTGQPALTLRTGMRADGKPRSTTLWSGLHRDEQLLRFGWDLERSLGVWTKRPPIG